MCVIIKKDTVDMDILNLLATENRQDLQDQIEDRLITLTVTLTKDTVLSVFFNAVKKV